MKKGRNIDAKKDGESSVLIDRFDAYLLKNEKTFIVVSLLLAALMSFLLFDIKVSLSGDDCDYIVSAGDFWKHFIYPGHHGPLYPIFLSPFVGIFGVKLLLLKLLSVCFVVSSIWFFYQAFKGKVRPLVLIPVTLLVCINPYVFFFAGYTYSEPMFLFMESLFFYFFSKYFWTGEDVQYDIKTGWRKYLTIAFLVMGMGLTRTLGFCVIGVVFLYFAYCRQWNNLLYTVGAFFVVFIVFYVLKPVIWPNSGTVHSFETLLAQNPYNPELGLETFSGLIQRFVENSHAYLSGYLLKYFGFRSWTDIPLEALPFATIIAYILFFSCFVTAFKKSKVLVFAGLYVGALCFMTFVLLHTVWRQDRMIMVYYPYILLFLLGGVCFILSSVRLRKYSFAYLLVLTALFIGTSSHSMKRVARNLPVLQQNILGDDLYGLTPDWENFVKMSRWAKENLPKDAVIVSRKPSISYVYTGREFYGIFSIPTENLQEVIQKCDSEKGRYSYYAVDVTGGYNTFISHNTQYIIVPNSMDFKMNDKPARIAVIYRVEEEKTSDFEELLNSRNANYTIECSTLLKQFIGDETKINLYDPDKLLNQLKEAGVKYLLLPKIRLYTPENTGYYINTIHLYVQNINMKYPDSFRLVNTIGKEEACELVEYVGR